jgi:hypothetical protein
VLDVTPLHDVLCPRRSQLVKGAHSVSHFQRAVLKIGNYLVVLAVTLVAVIMRSWRLWMCSARGKMANLAQGDVLIVHDPSLQRPGDTLYDDDPPKVAAPGE